METTSVEEEKTISCEEATAEFRGSLVRLDCGAEGVYLGIVQEVDPENAHIRIAKPFRDGVSLNNLIIQIPGELIKEILVVRVSFPSLPMENQVVQMMKNVKLDRGPLPVTSQRNNPSPAATQSNKPARLHLQLAASNQTEKGQQTSFAGYLATVYSSCSSDVYQGKIISVDAKEHSIRLGNPLLNGHPLSLPFIDLLGKNMKDVRLVRGPSPVRSQGDDPSPATTLSNERIDPNPRLQLAPLIHPMEGRRLQQNDNQEYASVCVDEVGASGQLASPPSSSTVSGDESDESADEYTGPKTFDQRRNKQQILKSNEAPNPEEMRVATPSSAYSIQTCPNPIQTKEMLASYNASSPRQRRITCAERMLMINHRQACNDGISVRSGTTSYANKNQPTPRSSSFQSNAVQIYMQSACKPGRKMMATIPSSDDSRINNSRPNSNNCHDKNSYRTGGRGPVSTLSNKNQQTPGSVRIMQKLFSPAKSDQQELNVKVVSNQNQCMTGQRIDVNDLLRGYTSIGAPLLSDRSSEPPTMSRPESAASPGNRESFKSPLRRPLSAVLLTPLNVGSASSFRVQRNRSPILMNGRYSLGSLAPHRRSSPVDSVCSNHFKRLSPPNASSPPTAAIRAPLAHQAFGEFKLFKEQQQAIPMRLQVNHRRNDNGDYGPTGIPAVDCSNGYRSYSDRYADTIMGDPLDPNMETDFDFAGNLALFDKAEFNRETEHIFHGLDSAGDCSRNYRNDENVLQDSSRVISWTKGTSVVVEDENQNTSTSSPGE